jgi:hypothetical protein
MPTVAEAAKVVSIETGEPETFVSQIARSLINNRVLPKNVGKRLSEVDEVNTAMLLLAVYTATTFADAAGRASQYANLKMDGAEDGPPFINFLVKALTDIRNRPDHCFFVSGKVKVPYDELRIEIITSYPLVIVSSVPIFGKPAFNGNINFADDPQLVKFWPSNKPRRSVTIPGHVLFEIVNRLFGFPDPSPAD